MGFLLIYYKYEAKEHTSYVKSKLVLATCITLKLLSNKKNYLHPKYWLWMNYHQHHHELHHLCNFCLHIIVVQENEAPKIDQQYVFSIFFQLQDVFFSPYQQQCEGFAVRRCFPIF